MREKRVKGHNMFSKWVFRVAIVALGIAFCIGFTTSIASAQTADSTSSLGSYLDSAPPVVINVQTLDTEYEGAAVVDSDFTDFETDVAPEESQMVVSDAFLSGCEKTNRKMKCSASGMSKGEHTARVSVKDKNGNRIEKEHKFTVTERQKPVTTDNAPTGWQNTDITVTLTCTDVGSGCASTTYEVNGGATQTGNTVLVTTEGVNTITYRSRDVAGNVENTKTATVKIDKTAPVIDSIEVSPDGDVTVLYHDPPPSSGIASIKVTVDGQELDCCICDRHHNGMGPYLGEGHQCEHGEGNGYGYGHIVDENHDVIDNNVFEYPVPAGSETEPNDFTCSLPGDLACGPHEIVATVTDYAGNSTTEETIYNKGDCEPPVTTDDAPSGWQNTDATVTLTCTDNFSGCASTTYEVNGGATQTGNTVLLTDEGVHTITYRSTDVAGNVETNKTATVWIDKTPPDVTTSGDTTVEATGPTGADVTYTSGATDALSGVVGSETCIPPSGSTFPLGSSTVTCSATDAAGNTGTGTLTVTVVDTTPPVVTGTDTTVEATGPSGAVATFTSSATDIVDGAVSTTCVPPSGSTFPLGSTLVSCSATDAAGNTGTGTLTVTVVDTTAPVVTYISPVDTIYDTTSPPITGTATDDVGVTSASAVIDGTTTVSCTVDGLGNVSCPTSSLAYGWHTAVIYASDAAGNTGSSTTESYCISSGRPNLMLYKIKGPYVVSGDPYRWVRVDYRMTNTGGPDAFNVRMLSMTANNGIYLTDPLPLPLPLGNIATTTSVNFTVKYYWPVGVTTYKFTNTACAEDQCFTEYFYP